MAIDPNQDGVSHVNMYGKGKTELGRFLTNFAHTPIDVKDGHFESVEGYWQWLRTPDGAPRRDGLRKLNGFMARKRGQELQKEFGAVEPPDFQERIREAVQVKLRNNPKCLESEHIDLPLEHYYIYGDKVYDQAGKLGWFTEIVTQELADFRAETEAARDTRTAAEQVKDVERMIEAEEPRGAVRLAGSEADRSSTRVAGREQAGRSAGAGAAARSAERDRAVDAPAATEEADQVERYYAVEHRKSTAKGHPRTSVHVFADAISMDDWLQQANKKEGVTREAYGKLSHEAAALAHAFDFKQGNNKVVVHSVDPVLKASAKPKPGFDSPTEWTNVPIPKRARGNDALQWDINEKGKVVGYIQLPVGLQPVEVTTGTKWRPESKKMDISGGVIEITPSGKGGVRNSGITKLPDMEGFLEKITTNINEGGTPGKRVGPVKDMQGSEYLEVGFPSTSYNGEPWHVRITVDNRSTKGETKVIMVDIQKLQAALVEHTFTKMLADEATRAARARNAGPRSEPAPDKNLNPHEKSPDMSADRELAAISARQQGREAYRPQRELALGI